MQQREELFARLARVRQVQARAMQRFAEAQARLRVSLSALDQDQEALSGHANSPGQEFLPANGDLESQESFIPAQQEDPEATERLSVLRNRPSSSLPEQSTPQPEVSTAEIVTGMGIPVVRNFEEHA